MPRFALLIAVIAASSGWAEIDASRDTMPKKFQGAPGLIKGGFLIEGSKKRFEGANELNLDAFKTISSLQLKLYLKLTIHVHLHDHVN